MDHSRSTDCQRQLYRYKRMSAAAPTVYNVTVNALPVPVITLNDPTCIGSVLTFITESGMTSYTWNTGGGTVISGAGTNTLRLNLPTTGTKYVSVNYTNASGCRA